MYTPKPSWETAVNSAAIALTAWGTTEIMNSRPLEGAVAMGIGAGLEYFKYAVREAFNR